MGVVQIAAAADVGIVQLLADLLPPHGCFVSSLGSYRLPPSP